MELVFLTENKQLEFYSVETDIDLRSHLASGIDIKFSSSDEIYLGMPFELNKNLNTNPISTFYARAKDNSLKDEGICDDDIIVIDKSLDPSDGNKAICFINGEYTIKTVKIIKDEIWLLYANSESDPIIVSQENNSFIWGIVTFVISKFNSNLF